MGNTPNDLSISFLPDMCSFRITRKYNVMYGCASIKGGTQVENKYMDICLGTGSMSWLLHLSVMHSASTHEGFSTDLMCGFYPRVPEPLQSIDKFNMEEGVGPNK